MALIRPISKTDINFGSFTTQSATDTPVDNNSYYVVMVLMNEDNANAPQSVTGADIVVPFYQGPKASGAWSEFYGVIKTTSTSISISGAITGNLGVTYIKVS